MIMKIGEILISKVADGTMVMSGRYSKMVKVGIEKLERQQQAIQKKKDKEKALKESK
jgi:hypothetical protein